MSSTPSKITRQALSGDLVTFCLLASVAFAIGFLANQFRDLPLPIVYQSRSERLQSSVARIAESQIATPKTTPNTPLTLPERISLAEFQEIVEKAGTTIVDARPEIFHRLGHVPGALALPRDDFENYYRKNQDRLTGDKNKTIVIYCSGDACEDSKLVEAALKQLGHSRISIFPGGWNEWTAAGLPEETTE